MAILNVQDYGAAGDGSADDTEAIQAAIDDTSKGDTVYIPGTDAYYKVTSGSRAAVQCQTAADNVTIEGDGESSVVKLGDTDDSKNQAAFGAEGDGPTMSGILVRDLVFSGNVSENSNDSAKAVSHYPSGTGHDITYRNVICEDSAGTGFANRGVSKITLENVTARNNTRHGFDFTADEDSDVTYDMEAHSIKSVNNGGTGLDFHRGKHLCETFYVENNDSGNKIGSSGGQPERMILRNGQIVGSNSSAWRSTGTGNSDVELENVQILDPEISGLNLRDDHNYTINSDVLVESANTSNSNSGWGCRLDESASLTVNGNLRVQSTNSNHGINHASSGSLEVSSYYHSGNDDGALRHTDDGGLSIDERIEQESSYLDVPASGDVGAYAGDGIIDDGGSDDSDDSTSSDDPVFEAWTPQWSSGQSSWGVTSTDSNVEDSVLELTAGSSGRHALSCDTVGTATDVDMLGLVRVPSDDDNSSSWCRLIGRGAGTAGSETGYFVAFRDVPNLGIAKYSGGDSTMLSAESVDFTPGNWYYVRFNLSGSELKARYWSLGEDEPQDWLLTATDSEISGDGWVGVGGWSTDTQQWDTFSVATGGDTAQFVGDVGHVEAVDVARQQPDGAAVEGEQHARGHALADQVAVGPLDHLQAREQVLGIGQGNVPKDATLLDARQGAVVVRAFSPRRGRDEEDQGQGGQDCAHGGCLLLGWRAGAWRRRSGERFGRIACPIPPHQPGMLEVSNTVQIPDDEIETCAVRSQGPGGQNVDKVASGVQLRFDVRSSSLPVAYRQGLLAMRDQRITKDGVVVIKAQAYRTQEQNREDARNRLRELIRSAGVTSRKRRPTRPSWASQRKRQEAKKRHKQKKAMRKKVL